MTRSPSFARPLTAGLCTLTLLAQACVAGTAPPEPEEKAVRPYNPFGERRLVAIAMDIETEDVFLVSEDTGEVAALLRDARFDATARAHRIALAESVEAPPLPYHPDADLILAEARAASSGEVAAAPAAVVAGLAYLGCTAANASLLYSVYEGLGPDLTQGEFVAASTAGGLGGYVSLLCWKVTLFNAGAVLFVLSFGRTRG